MWPPLVVFVVLCAGFVLHSKRTLTLGECLTGLSEALTEDLTIQVQITMEVYRDQQDSFPIVNQSGRILRKNEKHLVDWGGKVIFIQRHRRILVDHDLRTITGGGCSCS